MKQIYHFDREGFNLPAVIGRGYPVREHKNIIGYWSCKQQDKEYAFKAIEELDEKFGDAEGLYQGSECEFKAELRGILAALREAWIVKLDCRNERRINEKNLRSKMERAINKTLHCGTYGDVCDYYNDCYGEIPSEHATFDEIVDDIKDFLKQHPDSQLPQKWRDEYPERLAARKAETEK